MTHLVHAVAAFVYASLAVAAALTVPLLVAGADRLDGLLSGAAVFLFGALVHEIAARVAAGRAADADAGAAEDRIAWLEREVQALGGRTRQAGGPDLATVIAEVKLLQSLVGQLALDAREAAMEEAEAAAEPPQAPVPAGASGAAPRAPAVAPDDDAVLGFVRAALEADRVDVFIQPIVSLPQRKVRYYEVFSRIRAPDGGYLEPARYLPLARRAGLAAAIDDLLLFRSVRLVRETERRQQSIGFFVNVSADTLSDDRFMGEFGDYLAEHQSLGTRLVFEVAQAEIAAGRLKGEAVRRLRELGCRFSMDRVTSFDIDPEMLAAHDVRFVKLDAGMLLAIARRPGGHDNVLRFKRLIESRPIDVIAERIETEAQLVELLDLQIDFGQGFLFGEPYLSKAAQG
jgi:cyclic-di-GMP phosphodiesterase TipF (flagellum assembly factor)